MILERRFPWVAQQNWEDILFIHKAVHRETLSPYVPYPFELDLYNDRAWVSIVIFRAKGSRLRFMPKPLSFPPFYQMNIRTYVRFGKERGVYFFTIHASNQIMKMGGSIAGLPFKKIPINMRNKGGQIFLTAKHLFDHPESKFCISYEPEKRNVSTRNDSLPHFLVERYAIWMIRGNTIIKAPIFHTHWKLKKANISIHEWEYFPFPVTDDLIFHYSPFKHTVIYPFERIGKVAYV